MRDNTPLPFADRSPTAAPAVPVCEALGAARPEAGPSSLRLQHLFRHALKLGQVNPLLHILNHDLREEAP